MNKTATIKILNEIDMVILGLSVSDYKFFYEKFGHYKEGYRFARTYKLGRWDGKIRLFSEAGKTSIHFVEEIIADLKQIGYKIKLIDNRNPITFDLPLIDANYFSDLGFTLGNHQVECINALIENRGGIAIAATGAGKSYIIAALIRIINDNMNLRVMTIVPSKDLVTQTAAEIELFGNDVGVYHGSKKELNKKHIVSTWQSLQNTPEILSNYHAVIVDEAHGTKSNVLQSLLTGYANRAVFIAGVTGTLPKTKAEFEQVRYVLGDPVANVDGRYLMDLGWLAALKLRVLVLKEDFKKEWEYWKKNKDPAVSEMNYKQFKANYFPDFTSERTWLRKNERRNELIAQLVDDATNRNGNSFVLVNGVDFGRKLSKLIPNAIFIHGGDESEVRKRIYDSFSDNDDVVVIATYNLASTGLNIKRIFNLFLVDAGKSFIQIIQSIGRGLRKAEDKDSVNVWDISSDIKFSSRHLQGRKKYYKEQKYDYTEEKLDY